MNEPELLHLIRAAFALTDPVPPETRRGAVAAFRWLDPSASLAELTDDLLLEPSGVRGTGRLLTFTGPEVAIELEVTAHELVGRLEPPTPAHVQVRHAAGAQTARADRHGHFRVPRPPAGLLSLVFRLPDATSIVTSWVRL